MKEIMITSSVLILCIMLIRFLCRGRIGSRLQYALWLVVAIRLIVPVTAQIVLPPGMLDGFGIMDLVEDLDTNIGSLSERLEQPVGFTMRMDSLIGRQIAERVLAEEIEGFDTADGPTSIFLAGRTGVTWLDILQGIWHGGMGIMMVWMIAVNLRFRHKLHKKRREFSVPEAVLARMQEKLSGKIACPADTGLPEEGAGGRRTAGHGVKVYTVEKLVSPCLYGLPGWEAIYLLKQDGALSVSYTHDIEKQLDDMLRSLNLVIVVLIISAGMLAFVVLYNLNTVNIAERKRELATLKVLGFYNMEVAEYVYRENILLTFFGAVVGAVLGRFLHLFIIETVEVDSAMFGRNINMPSYIYSLILTVTFSMLINGVMYFKLKKIDMVESLKSIE